MHITFSLRSKFFVPIEQVIEAESQKLQSGQAITIQLEPGGYNRNTTITIDSNDSLGFKTDWSGKDPSRFSARLRAAATILFQKSFSGIFAVSHKDGVITIQRM